MRIGITIDGNGVMEENVSLHFGQCKYFLIVDVENGIIKGSNVVVNSAQHGGGGCLAVDEILKNNVTHVIAGGMGAGAQQKFAQRGVKIFGFTGKAKDGVEKLIKDSLGGIEACKDHKDH